MPQKESLKAVIERKKKSIPKEEGRLGKNYLFIIAINDYPNYNKLYNAVEDAKAIEQVLEERYVFDDIFTLHDAEASRDNILDYLELLEEQITATDNLFIFFSGHGYAQKKIGYIIPHDAPANTKKGFIPNSTLLNHLRHIEAHHILLILDSCFSGSLLVGKDVQIQSVAERVNKIPSRYAISAGNIELVSDGIAGNHSPFAQAVIHFLKDNTFENVPVSHLFMEVRKMTTYNAKQTPLGGPLFGMDNQGGEFVFQLKAIDELAYWQHHNHPIKVPAIQTYISENPKGTYTEAAYWKIAQLLRKDWAYDDYLKFYPNGKYAEAAIQGMEELEIEVALWQQTTERHTLGAYRGYLRKYPTGTYIRLAQLNIDALRGEKSKPPSYIGDKNSLIYEMNRKKYSLDVVPHIIKSTEELNTFTDPRDGQVYKTVKLKDGNIWMAQNLNFDVGEGCWFYDNDAKNGEIYGRLYTWEAAIRVCPEGWRLPSHNELDTLIGDYGGYKSAYKVLTKGAYSGFAVLLGGLYNSDGDFTNLGVNGLFWSSTEKNFSDAWSYDFRSIFMDIYRNNYNKSLGFSCRCLKG